MCPAAAVWKVNLSAKWFLVGALHSFRTLRIFPWWQRDLDELQANLLKWVSCPRGCVQSRASVWQWRRRQRRGSNGAWCAATRRRAGTTAWPAATAAAVSSSARCGAGWATSASSRASVWSTWPDATSARPAASASVCASTWTPTVLPTIQLKRNGSPSFENRWLRIIERAWKLKIDYCIQ